MVDAIADDRASGEGTALTGAGRGEHWVGTWAAAPQPALGEPAEYRGQTLRLIVRGSVGGDGARIRLSNAFGTSDLEIGAAYIARRAEGAAIAPGTSRRLSFDGHPSVTIAPGGEVTSDASNLAVEPLSDLAVSVYLPRPAKACTDHFPALQTSYVTRPGPDVGGASGFPFATALMSWPFLTAVEVRRPGPARAVVAVGDSLVDGAASTHDTNRRWPSILAVRLQHDHGANATAVLNHGIIGNRLLFPSPPDRPFHGPAGMARFEHGALSLTGVRYVIASFGINDIGFGGSVTPPAEQVTAAQLIEGFSEIATLARRNRITMIGSTITPFEGALSGPGFHTAEKERVRSQVNHWIRRSNTFDHVVDFDAVLRSRTRPSRLDTRFDSGDHLHPNDAGHHAMAEVFDLRIFQ
ncbi:SGNH/GDSL hydrolase family protein [Pseudonocardia acaciae]|uniref:SGNH/GDSL hydrolase family protein n=1 Tax=Pseudonocardia acaciae TaxID=551276 RepID=UPI0012EDD988|nr:SGNH/GDSL hydrolase family protein [Pseudonocardia acaciae]